VLGDFTGYFIQAYVGVGVIYIVVNIALSRLAERLAERRGPTGGTVRAPRALERVLTSYDQTFHATAPAEAGVHRRPGARVPRGAAPAGRCAAQPAALPVRAGGGRALLVAVPAATCRT